MSQVPIDELSMQQQDMLERLNIGPFVGRRAAETIQDVLYRSGLDLAMAAQRMDETAAAVEQGIVRTDGIHNSLDGLVDVATDRPETGVLIRVTFDRDTAIGNVVDLRDWSETWWEIARGIAMVHSLPPEDVIVIGAGRGSFILDLSVETLIDRDDAESIIMRGLAVAGRVIDLRIKAQNLREMQLKNTRLADELEAEAETEKQEAAEHIVSDIAQEAGLGTANRGDAIQALAKSVDALLDFLEKGGEVDPILPPAEEEPVSEEGSEVGRTRQGLAELGENVREIRRLEAQVRALEAGEQPPD